MTLEEKIEQIKEAKNKAIKEQNYEEAAKLRHEECKLLYGENYLEERIKKLKGE